MNTQVNIIVPDFFALDDLEVIKINVDQNNPKVALVIVGDNLNQRSKFNHINSYAASKMASFFQQNENRFLNL